jgi:Ca2+-transporting ATPase
VLHDAVPGRVRLRHPAVADAAAAERAVDALLALGGVESARASLVTGSVLVHYRAPATIPAIARALERSIRPPGRKRVADQRPAPPLRLNPVVAGANELADTHRLEAAPPAPRRKRGTATRGDAPQAEQPAWHATTIADALATTGAHASRGLAEAAVEDRRRRYGPNALAQTPPRSIAEIALEQVTSLPIALLGGSAVLSLATGGIADAIAIGAVVAANATIATTTERKAERTILGLSRYEPHPVTVIRDGAKRSVPPSELVPGDVIELEPGTLVAADARLLDADELSVNESALTGEALPVHKDARAKLRPDAPLGDRATMVFRGTAVTGGRGRAVVVATGGATEIGRIQQLLGAVRPPETLIQRQLGEVEKELVIVNAAICAGVFALGVLRGHGFLPMLRTAVSLAVAAIPEGLPTVATTTLAIGIQDMRRRNVLVRKLEAVETLGAVEIVGMDKTGTLTQNRMAVVAAHVDGTLCRVKGGRLAAENGSGAAPDKALSDIAAAAFEVASLCSDAQLGGGDGADVTGSPTEAALVRAALAFGVDVAARRKGAPIVATAQRSTSRKRMSTLHAIARGRRRLCVKGDPVEVLERCTQRLTRKGLQPLDAKSRAEILRANQRMAGEALRVLGMAASERGGDTKNERGLTWLGLAGLADPIRPNAPPAIKVLHGAGIRTVMVTGDQSATAFAIARELDLADGAEVRVLEAGRIRGVDPQVLAAIAANPHVFSRVSPTDKLEIVRALQAGGHIVAMTGDGINDGPALKAADVGIAMGGEGTDVAREVADIVLATDDLNGVIEAVRLGRATYANIRKVLRFLVGTNSAETMVMLGASIAGWPEPLSPMQLLWLNLVTDVLPGLALGLEPPEPDVLEQKPHDPQAPIFGRADFRRLLLEGGIIGGMTLAAFLLEGGARGPLAPTGVPTPSRASTVAFHGLTLAQLVHAVACRSEHHGIVEELRRTPNRKLYAALAACLALQGLAQSVPGLRALLGIAPLRARDVAAIAAVSLGSAATIEAATQTIRRVRAARA